MAHVESGPDLVQRNGLTEGSAVPIAFLGTIIQVLLLSATSPSQEHVLHWSHSAKGAGGGH